MNTLLEGENRVFEGRYEKSASALVAVAQTLEKERPLSGSEKEFLNLYQLALKADPDNFSKVWLDPSAYFWVRVAYELLGSCLSDTHLPTRAREYCETLGVKSPKKALVCHLHAFKSFILGIHFLEGKDSIFETPLKLDFPYSIPGTLLSLEGAGQVEIAGIEAGKLKGTYESQPFRLDLHPGASCVSDKIVVSECPVVTYSGCETMLKPQAFNNLPSLDFVKPSVDAGLQFQRDHKDLVLETLKIIERYHEDSFHYFQDYKMWIGLKPLQAGNYSNITCSELPLSFVASIYYEPYVLADTFIHEFNHNRLFFIEENGAFLGEAEVDPITDYIYYSPWRKDNRPLQGILHALYVHVPVNAFWFNVIEAGKVSDERLAFARSQWLRTYLQMVIGRYQLNRFGSFTSIGREFFKELERAVEAIGKKVADSSFSYEIPAIVCEENGTLLKQKCRKSNRELNVAEATLDHIASNSPEDQKLDILKEQICADLKRYVSIR